MLVYLTLGAATSRPGPYVRPTILALQDNADDDREPKPAAKRAQMYMPVSRDQ